VTGDGSKTSLRRIFGTVRPARSRLLFATLLGAAASGCGIALLATSAWLISRAAQHPSIVALGLAVIGVRFFAVSRGLARYSERLVGHDAALRVLADLRARIYERLEVLAPNGLPAFRRGDLLARLVHDVDALQDFMLRVLPPYVIALLVGVPTVAFVWWVLPEAGGLLGLSLIAGATVVPWFARRLAQHSEKRLAAARGELTVHIVDLIEGAADLVAFGAVDAQLGKVAGSDRELTGIATAASRNAGLTSGLVAFLMGLAVWSALLVGVPAVDGGRLSGPLLAVIALVPLAAFDIVMGLPAAAQKLQQVRESATRVFAVLDAPAVVEDPADPIPLPEAPHHVCVRDLWARYEVNGPWALAAFDLELPPGGRVAIVGPSGAGKSTLASVLTRLLPYERGSVTISGFELAKLAGEDVRRAVGLATPDTYIFATTVRENLLLARRDATDSDLRRALERARLLDWVNDLPAGLDTEIGERGNLLSGGQQQRLGIARVLLADFPILVLDEPGEHLDTATADSLLRDLLELTRGRSSILITHRFAVLDAVDEILYLQRGRIIERGSHDELIAAGGPYERQWRREQAFNTSLVAHRNPEASVMAGSPHQGDALPGVSTKASPDRTDPEEEAWRH
jgi:thiol reductant ABC exporter CydC subunit